MVKLAGAETAGYITRQAAASLLADSHKENDRLSLVQRGVGGGAAAAAAAPN